MYFIYNEGTSRHRGAWHMTEAVSRKVHEAEETTTTYDSIDWGRGVPVSNRVSGIEYYVPRGLYPAGMCQRCGKSEEMHPQLPRLGQHQYEERRAYPILGRTTLIVSTPEYLSYTATATCGSGKFSGTNIDKVNIYRIGHMKQYLGKTLKVVGGTIADGKVFKEGTTPPEPFCSHCLKQIEKKYGTSMREVITGIEVLD